MVHRERMKARRERQLARTPGFTPVRNERVEKAIATQEALISLAALNGGGVPNAIEVREQALRNVARSLPKPQPSKLYRHRPSKSDSPAYRKVSA
jgi:hypothetical protein